MADEEVVTPQEPQEPVAEPEATPTPETGAVATETVEPVAEPTPEPPAEGTTEPVEEPDNRYLIKEKVDGKEIVWDIRDEAQRKDLAEKARQGHHYTEKMQKVSEFEKSNEQWAQLGRAAIGNPAFLQAMMATQLGFQPEILYGPTTPPPDWMRESDPASYAKAQAQYEMTVQAKQVVDRSVTNYLGQVASSSNQLAFDRAKLQFDLSDDEASNLRKFVENKMRPNQLGVYESGDIENAYWALFGKQKMASDSLKKSESIKTTIKQATQPQKNVPQKQERLTKAQKEEREFTQFVKENAS